MCRDRSSGIHWRSRCIRCTSIMGIRKIIYGVCKSAVIRGGPAQAGPFFGLEFIELDLGKGCSQLNSRVREKRVIECNRDFSTTTDEIRCPSIAKNKGWKGVKPSSLIWQTLFRDYSS